MKPHFSICAVLLAVFVIGCNGGSTVSSPGDLQGRLRAAREIVEPAKKNSALVTVAKDAGKAGNGGIANKAIAEIADLSLRDSTAAEVAVSLADVGKSNEAVDVAKQITQLRLRTQTMEKIAAE